jgi:hypothetical protein
MESVNKKNSNTEVKVTKITERARRSLGGRTKNENGNWFVILKCKNKRQYCNNN